MRPPRLGDPLFAVYVLFSAAVSWDLHTVVPAAPSDGRSHRAVRYRRRMDAHRYSDFAPFRVRVFPTHDLLIDHGLATPDILESVAPLSAESVLSRGIGVFR